MNNKWSLDLELQLSEREPFGFIEWNCNWFQERQDQTLNAILIHKWTVIWSSKKKTKLVNIFPASFRQENSSREMVIGCWQWAWARIGWKWVGRERRKLQKIKNVYDYFSNLWDFIPFVGRVFQGKVVNSPEQFCARLRVLRTGWSLPRGMSVSCTEGMESTQPIAWCARLILVWSPEM